MLIGADFGAGFLTMRVNPSLPLQPRSAHLTELIPSCAVKCFQCMRCQTPRTRGMEGQPTNRVGLQDTWDKLRVTLGGSCWDEDGPMELRHVLRFAREAGGEAHWETLFAWLRHKKL